MHFLYIYNEELIRKLEGMHQEDPGALSNIFIIKIQKGSLKECAMKIQLHFLSMYNKDLIRRLEGMHQEGPGAFSLYV